MFISFLHRSTLALFGCLLMSVHKAAQKKQNKTKKTLLDNFQCDLIGCRLHWHLKVELLSNPHSKPSNSK